MKPTLSSNTRDVFDVIKVLSSYLPIAGVGFLLLAFAFGNNSVREFFTNHKIIAIICAAIMILSPLWIPFILNIIGGLILKRRNLGRIIIERQDIFVDITDAGATANFYEKLTFHKIGRFFNNHFVSTISVDGDATIENICTTNCYCSLNHEKNRASISYVNSMSKLNTYPNLVKKADRFWALSATLKNTFTQKEESWDLIPDHYCINYNLHLTLPIGQKVKSANLYRITRDHNLNQIETPIKGIHPIVTIEHGRQKIILHLTNYDYGELLRLKWSIL